MKVFKNFQFSGKFSAKAKILISIFLLAALSVLYIYLNNPKPQQQLSLKTPEINNKPQPYLHAPEKPGIQSKSLKRMLSKKQKLKASVSPNKQNNRPPLSISKKNLPKTAPKTEPEIPADELLESPEVENRLRALNRLEDLADKGDKEARGLLYESLKDDNGEVRARAAESLGWIEDKQAVESLTELLKNDEDPEARASAADALGEIGDKTAIGALKEAALNDEDEDAQDDAMDAIEALREQE
mgnify:CR=1 FL=1